MICRFPQLSCNLSDLFVSPCGEVDLGIAHPERGACQMQTDKTCTLHTIHLRALSGELFLAAIAAQVHCWQLADNPGVVKDFPQLAPEVITGVT